jgi:hypothetical protein
VAKLQLKKYVFVNKFFNLKSFFYEKNEIYWKIPVPRRHSMVRVIRNARQCKENPKEIHCGI